MLHIHQVKTRMVNSYVVEYSDKLLVMDVASRSHRYVLGFIEHELQRSVEEVRLVTCTHDDPDHIGGVFDLAALTNAAIAIPLASKLPFHKLMKNPSGGLVKTATSVREAFRARSWQMYINPERDRQARAKPQFMGHNDSASHLDRNRTKKARKVDHRLRDQQALPEFNDWQVLHTPGHSWDSSCFFHRETGSLLTGDTLLGSAKTGRLAIPSIYSNAGHTRSTLTKLERLNIQAVYPGHGSIITGTDLISKVDR